MINIHSINNHKTTWTEVYCDIITELAKHNDCKKAYGIVSRMARKEIMKNEKINKENI